MTFPRFLRFYNPFRRIRELSAIVDTAEQYNAFLSDRLLTAGLRIGHLQTDILVLQADRENLGAGLAIADRVVDEHVRYIDELNQMANYFAGELHVSSYAIANLSNEVAEDAEIIQSLAASLDAAQESDRQQSQDTVQSVTYIRAVEAELAANGITVVDGETGPVVRVDQPRLLEVIRSWAPAQGTDAGYFDLAKAA